VTPLNQLLLEAIEIAKRREPDLTEPEIARRAGLAKSHLSRAKKRCGAATLAAVFDTLGFDVAVVEMSPKQQRRARR
jgi:DNA-binding phage protein